MVSRASATSAVPSRGRSAVPVPHATTADTRQATKPKLPLSPETLSTVESTLFPLPRDDTVESERIRFRADWRRWVAPLTLLQTLMKNDRVKSAPAPVSLPSITTILTAMEEKRLKDQ